jgi:hypothetical protein
MEMFSPMKLNEEEVKEKYCTEVSNRFAALDAEVEVNAAWEVIRENIKNGAKENIDYYEL